MISKDELGDRMKSYESIETDRRFDPTLPVYARIDGRGFSRFTRGMERPFDQRMTDAMIDTTRYLVEKTHATVGYVQSDEISLVWPDSVANNGLFFAGKIQKSCSVLASMAAARFAVAYAQRFGEMSELCPHFDCRIVQMPGRTEAANMMLWRELDARKNAVSMAARHHFSHRELQGKSSADMIQMMDAKGVHMGDYPVAFRRGTWLRRISESRMLTSEELARIPVQHQALANTMLVRSSVKVVDMPTFVTVTNREDVVFGEADPIASA